MEIHIPELEDLKNEIIKMRELMNAEPVLTQEWYDLSEACKLKGVNKNTVSNKPKYQPAYGREDAILVRFCTDRASVIMTLSVSCFSQGCPIVNMKWPRVSNIVD